MNKAQFTLLLCALSCPWHSPVSDNQWVAVALIALGRLDIRRGPKSFYIRIGFISKKATASVVGIGGMVGLPYPRCNLTLGKTIKR
jgi:hypothetical protein